VALYWIELEGVDFWEVSWQIVWLRNWVKVSMKENCGVKIVILQQTFERLIYLHFATQQAQLPRTFHKASQCVSASMSTDLRVCYIIDVLLGTS